MLLGKRQVRRCIWNREAVRQYQWFAAQPFANLRLSEGPWIGFEVGQVQGEVPRVSKESRKKLASLSFSEKVKLLEKLRQRSLSLAKARKKLQEKTAGGKSSTDTK